MAERNVAIRPIRAAALAATVSVLALVGFPAGAPAKATLKPIGWDPISSADAAAMVKQRLGERTWKRNYFQ